MNKQICRITDTTLGFQRGCLFTAMLQVEYGGCSQGIGGFIFGYNEPGKVYRPTKNSAEFIMRVIRACGVETWEQVKGRTIFALYEGEQMEHGAMPLNTMPIGIENLPPNGGEQFLFGPWQKRAEYEQSIEKALFDPKGALSVDGTRFLRGWTK